MHSAAFAEDVARELVGNLEGSAGLLGRIAPRLCSLYSAAAAFYQCLAAVYGCIYDDRWLGVAGQRLLFGIDAAPAAGPNLAWLGLARISALPFDEGSVSIDVRLTAWSHIRAYLYSACVVFIIIPNLDSRSLHVVCAADKTGHRRRRERHSQRIPQQSGDSPGKVHSPKPRTGNNWQRCWWRHSSECAVRQGTCSNVMGHTRPMG